MKMPIKAIAKLSCLVVCSLMVIIGCQHAKAQPQLALVEKDAFSGRADKAPHFMIVSGQADFAVQYGEIHAARMQPPTMPTVDFLTHRVLLAFLGQQSTAGYGIDFQPQTAIEGETLVVTVILTKPDEDAQLAQVMTSPYAMATVQREGYGQVKFVDPAGETLAVRDVK